MIRSLDRLKRSRIVAALGAALTVTLLATACTGGSSAPSTTAAKPAELRMLYTTDEANSAAVASLVPQFKEKFGIDLKIDNQPYDALQQKVFSEFASSSSYYDIVVVDTPWAPALVQNLEPLSQYLENGALNPDSPQSNVGDFIPKVFYDTAVYNADSPIKRYPDPTAKPDPSAIKNAGFDVYGMPVQSNVAVMAYRSDLFNDPVQKANFKAKYGKDLTVPKTWDDYAQVAEFFTQPDKKLYGTTVMAGVGDWATDDFKTLLASFGGDGTLADQDGKPMFDTPEGTQALNYYARLAQSGHVPPGSTSADWGTTAESFGSGLTAMTINYHDLKLGDNVKGGTIGYAPVPSAKAAGPHFGTWMLSVNKYSKNKEWAYQGISWLTAAEQQTTMTAKSLHPSRTSVFAGIKSDNPLAPFYDTLGKSLAEGVGRARLTNYTEVSHEVAVAVNNAATGASSPSDSLKSASVKVSALLKSAGY
ncbi:multiple sugar transport system substrate-binding protein [Arthrobacter ulcerisalmonis]|nr:extracellular solute-binding protein [Arthrobacter ulcerisalmonis]MDQ0662518.1 multiple sugar transport system substrate-binding protein [Arthrobacter ulcerisalmonis]